MKRILTIMALTVALSASAQIHKSQSFLNATSINFSNSTTFVTNLLSTLSPGTNNSGVTWTNKSGVRNLATNSTFQAVNLLGKAQLWTDRNALAGTGTLTNSSIYVRFGSIGASATNAVTFIFVPVPNGVNALDSTNKFIFTTPLTVKLTQGYIFSFNNSLWNGCKEVMLQSVQSVETTSADSQWTLLECSLNGFMP